MDEHGGKRLVSESTAGRLYVYWEEYKGTLFLHIRYWYHDKKNDQWKPAGKGIAIAEGNVRQVLQAACDVADRQLDDGTGIYG